MAFNFGQYGEFTDPVTNGDPVIAAVAKVIEPGPYKGQFYQAMGAPTVPLDQKIFEVYTRSKTSRNGVIGATPWDADDVTGLSVSAAAAKGLTVGHVIKIGSEVVIVKEVNRTNNTIAVFARGAGGSTAGAHDAATAFTVIGFAGADLDLKNVESISESTSKYENYMQTFFETNNWLKQGELVRKGLSEAQAKVVLLKEAELRFAELLSIASIHGLKQKPTDDSDRFMSAGLISQLKDSNSGNRRVFSYNANGPISEVIFKAALKELFDNGGNPTSIWASPTNKGFINNFAGACNADVNLTDSPNNHTAGGLFINAYNYEGKIIPIRVDQDMPDDIIPILNMGDCKKGWLKDDGMVLKDEPTQSTREMRKSLQGTTGFLIENVGVNHTYIYGVNGGPTEKVSKVSIQGIGDGVTVPIAGTVEGGISATGAIAASGAVTATGAFTRQILVNADANVPAASADNFGYQVKIGTGWTGGTKIVTAVAGEVWSSNGEAWVKQS